MKIFINGQPLDIAHSTPKNLSHVLGFFLSEDHQQRSFAVALNGDFVGKPDYQCTFVKPNDCIDVLFPIQGG